MATLVRNYTGGNAGATSVATSASSPAGTPTAGNLLVAFVGYRTVTGVTVSATGWTAQTAVANGTVGGHTILSKVSDGSETATMTFQLAASVKAAVVVLEFSGASATLKNVVAGAVNSSAVAAHTGSAVAAPLSSDQIVFFDHNTVSDAATVSSNASATPTTGWTNSAAGASTGGSATTRNKVVAATITGRTASTTPSITWSTTITGTKQQLQVQNAFVPNTPTSVATSAQGAVGFLASWAAGATDSSHDAPTTYLLDVSTNSGFSSFVSGYNGLDVGAVTSYGVTGLSPSTQYYWRVRANNSAGTSANAAPSPTSITTNAAPSDAYGAAVAATAGLIGYWRLNESSGNAIDTAIGRTGTYPASGVTRAQTGLVIGSDTAAVFAGTGDRIDLGDVYDFIGTSPYTIEIWVLPTTIDATYRRILSKTAGTVDGYDLIIQVTGGIYGNRWSSVTTNTAHYPSPTASTLYHVVMTYDGSTLQLFVNGTEVTPGSSTTGTIANSAATFMIGGSGTGEFIGTLDELAIYNTAISGATITSHYNTGTGAGGTTAVGKDQQTSWHVRAAIGQAQQSSWHTRALVTQSRQTAWNVRTLAAQTLQSAWHVRALVTQSRQTAWHTRALAGQNQQSSWHVRTVVAKAQQFSWHVRALAAQLQQTAWHVRALAGQQQQTSWHVRAIVAKAQQASWHVRAIVAKSQQTSWNVASSLLTVGQDQQIAWHVRMLASRSQDASWHVRQAVGLSQQSAWATRVIVAAEQALAWHVRATAGQSQQTSWDIRAKVASTQQTSWHVRAIVYREQQTAWNVFHVILFVPVGCDQQIAWHLRANVGRDQQTSWHVLYGVRIIGAWGEFNDALARGRVKKSASKLGKFTNPERRVIVTKPNEVKGEING